MIGFNATHLDSLHIWQAIASTRLLLFASGLCIATQKIDLSIRYLSLMQIGILGEKGLQAYIEIVLAFTFHVDTRS